jgi:hypothetical protein
MKIAIVLFSMMFSVAALAAAPQASDCGGQYVACGKPGAGPGVPNPAPPRTGRK